MKPVFETNLAGFPIKVEQREDKYGRFKVTYGKQVRDGLCYSEAARELGLNIFHALACEGKLDNEGV